MVLSWGDIWGGLLAVTTVKRHSRHLEAMDAAKHAAITGEPPTTRNCCTQNVISTTKADKPWSGRKNRRLFVTSGGQPSGEQIIRKTVHKIKNGQVWFCLNKAIFSIKEKDEVSYRLEDELRDQSTLRTRTLAGRL